MKIIEEIEMRSDFYNTPMPIHWKVSRWPSRYKDRLDKRKIAVRFPAKAKDFSHLQKARPDLVSK